MNEGNGDECRILDQMFKLTYSVFEIIFNLEFHFNLESHFFLNYIHNSMKLRRHLQFNYHAGIGKEATL